MSEEEISEVHIWNMIDGSQRAQADIAQERLAICEGCEFFRPKSKTCQKCGCFMKLKTKLEKAHCPVGKW